LKMCPRIVPDGVFYKVDVRKVTKIVTDPPPKMTWKCLAYAGSCPKYT